MAKIDLEAQVSSLLAWKDRQEQQQADRLVEMRNTIVEVFSERHATVTEIQTVLEMVKLDMLSEFVSSQKERARIAAKEYPAQIKE